MTTFLQSAYSFGGYTFPYGFILLERDQDSRIDEVDVPYRDGSLAPAGVDASKVIRLQGQIGGDGAVDSAGNLITTRDQCTAECNLLASYLKLGYQQLKVGDADGRYIWAQKAKFKASYEESQGSRIAYVEIEFHAQDPRWLSAATHTNVGAAFGQGAVIANAGSGISYPTCTFTGNTVNPSFGIDPTGSNSKYITVTATVTLAAGDVLVFDCDPRNRANAVLLNGVPRIDLLGTNGCVNNVGDDAYFPYMSPGNNNLKIGGTGSVNYSAGWQDAWAF